VCVRERERERERGGERERERERERAFKTSKAAANFFAVANLFFSFSFRV
jgi:hypothetical protein